MSAYVIAAIDVTDPETYKGYSERAPATIEKYGGRYLARGGGTTTLEGEESATRNVVIEFDSVEAAQRWYDSPEYREAKSRREGAAVASIIVLQGV